MGPRQKFTSCGGVIRDSSRSKPLRHKRRQKSRVRLAVPCQGSGFMSPPPSVISALKSNIITGNLAGNHARPSPRFRDFFTSYLPGKLRLLRRTICSPRVICCSNYFVRLKMHFGENCHMSFSCCGKVAGYMSGEAAANRKDVRPPGADPDGSTSRRRYSIVESGGGRPGEKSGRPPFRGDGENSADQPANVTPTGPSSVGNKKDADELI